MISSLIWTAIGTVGAGGGIWIAAMFVPQIALLLKAALDFIRSPIGTAAAIIVAIVVTFALAYAEGDVHGTNATRAAWRADNLAKAAAAQRLIARNRVAAAADADSRIAEIDAYAKSLEEKVTTYEQQNESRAVCRLTPDDVKRLQNLRGDRQFGG